MSVIFIEIYSVILYIFIVFIEIYTIELYLYATGFPIGCEFTRSSQTMTQPRLQTSASLQVRVWQKVVEDSKMGVNTCKHHDPLDIEMALHSNQDIDIYI